VNVAELLTAQVLERPEAIAIIERGRGGADRRTSFAQLDRLGATASAAFAAAGVREGDTVIVLVGMSAELYAVLLGLWRIGAVAMLVDPSAGEERIAACCAAVPPRGVVLSAKAHLLLVGSATLRSVPLRFSTVTGLPGSRPVFPVGGTLAIPSICARDAGDPALVTFTSGSTGAPKAVGRSHGFLLAQYGVLRRSLGLAPGQIDLTTLPVFVLANLGSGVTTVVPDADLRRVGRIDAAPVVAQIARLGVTRMLASPAFLGRIVETAEHARMSLVGLRSVHTGGGPVMPSLLRRLAAVAPDSEIVAVYGSTEAEPIAEQAWSSVTAADLERMRCGAGLLAGRPVDEARVRTADLRWGSPAGPFTSAEFDQRTAAPGVAGEIVVTGEHVLKGYLDSARDAETKFRVDGEVWHRTGDVGSFDDQGRLWLLGRAGTAVGGIHPLGVEAALDGTPGLVRSALVPGEAGLAVLAVQSDGTLDLAAVAVHARELGVETVRPVPEIPMDARHNSKVDYPRLREVLAREGGARSRDGGGGDRRVRSGAIRLLPAIAWMLAIFAFSSLPGSDIPPTTVWLSPLAHFLEYAVLAALMLFAIGSRELPVRLLLIVVLACSLYGVTDEIHQRFTPGRTPDPIDWLTDTAGAACAVAAISALRRRRA